MKENKIASRESESEVCIPDETLKPGEESQPETMRNVGHIIKMFAGDMLCHDIYNTPG